jgi:hypothetical protein
VPDIVDLRCEMATDKGAALKVRIQITDIGNPDYSAYKKLTIKSAGEVSKCAGDFLSSIIGIVSREKADPNV